MLIEKEDLHKFIDQSLNTICNAEFHVHQHPCFHCGCMMCYPIIARQSDIEAFETLMNVAQETLDKMGVTENLFVAIRIQIDLVIAKKKASLGKELK